MLRIGDALAGMLADFANLAAENKAGFANLTATLENKLPPLLFAGEGLQHSTWHWWGQSAEAGKQARKQAVWIILIVSSILGFMASALACCKPLLGARAAAIIPHVHAGAAAALAAPASAAATGRGRRHGGGRGGTLT